MITISEALWQPPNRTACSYLYERHKPSIAFHHRPPTSLTPSIWRHFPTVFSLSSEVCLACFASSLGLVSHGGALVDSWGIWRPQEPRCPVCRSLCRWPSSRMGPHPFQPRWRWRTHEGSPGPPPGIDQEPERRKNEIMGDITNLIFEGKTSHLCFCISFCTSTAYFHLRKPGVQEGK